MHLGDRTLLKALLAAPVRQERRVSVVQLYVRIDATKVELLIAV